MSDLDCLQHDWSVIDLNRRYAELIGSLADAAAQTANCGRALPYLRKACQGQPLNEPLHARLITALHDTGHRSEATSVFDQLRSRLGKELGIRPSAEVWRAYELISTT